MTVTTESSSDQQNFFNFPPFFTLQPNLQLQSKQLQMWMDHLAVYCAKNKKYEIGLNDKVFVNEKINRRMSFELFEALANAMIKCGRADKIPAVSTPRDEKTNSNSNSLNATINSVGYNLRVYGDFTSKRELAEVIHEYARRTGRAGGGVETVYSLYDGEETERERFWGLPRECIIAGLKLLEVDGKCELFSTGDDDENAGVKFFE